MRWVPLAILMLPALEAIGAVVERFAVHIREDELHPDFRVFQYGTRGSVCNKEWFFILKLPSYDWQRSDYSRRWGWCQLTLLWTSTGGWQVIYVPVREQAWEELKP